MDTKAPNQLEPLYRLRDKFVIIGLTGRIGSGCTSVSKFLTSQTFEANNFPHPQTRDFNSNEERKYRITYNFMQKNWKQFVLIRASDVITTLILTRPLEELKSFLEVHYKDSISEIKKIFESSYGDSLTIAQKFIQLQGNVEKFFIEDSVENKFRFNDSHSNLILTQFECIKKDLSELTISKFSNDLKKSFENLATSNIGSPFQLFGDNIRKTGSPYNEDEFKPENSFIISEIINQIIKLYKRESKGYAHIVIDSIRNSMEARYFKERFSAFYLFAINTENRYRIDRLRKLKAEDVRALDNEYNRNLKTEETFYRQDIKTCIQVSDIYLYNPNVENGGDSFSTIKKDLIRYLALIFQPAIITPTSEERCMQIAYTAKYNSGCISRQVGAIVTDNRYSVKSIGWNNTPEGQTPCLLRNVDDLRNNTDSEAFSEYEKKSEIRPLIESTLKESYTNVLNGRNLSFCFKEAQNCHEHHKNQVHTRSLHAEENAMLQIAKYGGEGLKDGFLFTTASPCELCSKKAYQLGITKVFYIDPYPGIAKEQILQAGVTKYQPQLKLFVGAIGRAYHNLFEPFLAYKDELKLRLKYEFVQKSSNTNSIQDFEKQLKNLLKSNADEITEIIKKNLPSKADSSKS